MASNIRMLKSFFKKTVNKDFKANQNWMVRSQDDQWEDGSHAYTIFVCCLSDLTTGLPHGVQRQNLERAHMSFIRKANPLQRLSLSYLCWRYSISSNPILDRFKIARHFLLHFLSHGLHDPVGQ